MYLKPIVGKLVINDWTYNPEYYMPRALEVITCCALKYGHNKERILRREDALRYTSCRGKMNNLDVIVGSLTSYGLTVGPYTGNEYGAVGVCPVWRFFF